MAPPETLNIADVFLTARPREGRGDRVALRLADRDLTYTEVDRLANRFGNALRALGVRQEERVLLALPDGAQYAGALFGVLKLGAVAVMVNPGLPVTSLATILGYARASAAVTYPTTKSAGGLRHQHQPGTAGHAAPVRGHP